MENAYKILDIIKKLKSNHIGCYYDKLCDVESMGLKIQLQINSAGKISYRLVAVPDINVDGEDSLISTIGENPQLVFPWLAASSSSLNERGRQQSTNFSNTAS